MIDTLKTGLMRFPAGDSIHPAELTVAAEERGFDSLWVAEHSHIPASRKTLWPCGRCFPGRHAPRHPVWLSWLDFHGLQAGSCGPDPNRPATAYSRSPRFFGWG
ncbi:MAG: hypothetical protein CL908_13400 [Deltaproteobacteria bacterium]|jgi:hypothetical protein|nr:hypothetical protein [Deltaproteobacteria bacterium]